MDKHISIDINVSKLLEWLISRRHCTNDWQSEVGKLRAKINSAIQDMPEHRDIVNLLSGTYIHYFHCLKIIEILKETEADSKNIFGSYTSQRMKDWQNIVSTYTKNNVYLAEAGELLHNTVKFEIPSLKKQITKLHQLENDYKKKEVDAAKSSSSAKNELSSLLKELGIETATSNYRGSLLGKANQLNDMNAQVASESKNLLSALNHYVEFTKFSVPHHTVDLGLINYLSEKGNTTTYEYQNGVCPTRVELPQSAAEESGQAENGDVDGIDWGFDVDTTSCQIEVVDAGESKNDADSGSASAADPNEILATGSLALSILDNSATRTNLTNQLKELQMFLKLRLYESDKEGTVDSIVESKQALQEMLTKVEEILELLTSTTALHYYNILYSPKYLDDILQKIEQKENIIERSAAIVAMSKERAKECAQEAVALNKKAQVIVKKSKELQNEGMESQLDEQSKDEENTTKEIDPSNEDTDGGTLNTQNKAVLTKTPPAPPTKNKTFVSPRNPASKRKLSSQLAAMTSPVMKEAVNLMKSIKSNRRDKDEFNLFGEQVAIKLRRMNSSYAQFIAQNKINNDLYEAELGMYDFQMPNVPLNTRTYSAPFSPSPNLQSPSHVAYHSQNYPAHYQLSPSPSPSPSPSSTAQPTESFPDHSSQQNNNDEGTNNMFPQ